MSRPDPFTRLSREQADRLRAIAAQVGEFALPLLDALADGRITLVIPRRSDRAPLDAMRRASRPVIVLLGDDDYASTGPEGWRCAQKVTRWAHGAVVHGAGGERAHYQSAVDAALVLGRFLLVETSSEHTRGWAALLAGKPVLAVLPRGGPHPLPLHEEVRH